MSSAGKKKTGHLGRLASLGKHEILDPRKGFNANHPRIRNHVLLYINEDKHLTLGQKFFNDFNRFIFGP